MNNTLDHLRTNERAALQKFVGRLYDQHGRRIVEVWLFGSKARGDFGPDSDLDVLIVLDDKDAQMGDVVRLTAARVSLEYDVLINTHLLSREQWAALSCQRAPYWRNVQHEGVLLSPEMAPAH